MVCICYVDDCLFFARKETDIAAMIEDLHKDLTLEVEEEVIQFLEIEHTHTQKINWNWFKQLSLRRPWLPVAFLIATQRQH